MSSLMNGSENHGAESHNSLLNSFLSQFVVPRRTDEEEDDDWLKANFSDPDDNNENNTDNDNVPELDEEVEGDNKAEEDDDEGMLEATTLHQVGYYDKDGTPYGSVYTRESLEPAEGATVVGESCFHSDDEDADDEGDFFNNNATFSAMEAYHAFAMRKRVEEANERWRTSHTIAPKCHHRESKVQFAQLIQMFEVEQAVGDEENDSDRPCKPVVTFKPLPQDQISDDEEIDDPLTQPLEPLTHLNAEPLTNSGFEALENPTKELDFIDFYSNLHEQPSNVVEPMAPILQGSPLEPEIQPNEPLRDPLDPPEKTQAQEKASKANQIKQKIVRKSSNQPQILETPPKIQLKLNKVESEKFEKGMKSSRKSAQGTGLLVPKSERKPRSTPKPKSDSNIPQNDPPKVIRRSTKTTVSSFSIFPPPTQNQPESPGINPILQSVLDPKTLSALTRSWSNNPVNVHMLRELKSQILRHNIPRTALQPFVNKRMMSIIFDLPAEKVLSDFMRETVSSKGRNQTLRIASPSPARISLSAESGSFKSLTRKRSTGQRSSSAVTMKSAATILKSESVSKWASKPGNLKGSTSSGKFKKSAAGARVVGAGGTKLVPGGKISTTIGAGGTKLESLKWAQPINETQGAEPTKATKAGNLKPVRAFSSLENKADKFTKIRKGTSSHEPETKSCCSFSGASADKLKRAPSLKGKARKKKQIITKSKLENGFLALSLSKKILDITTMSSASSSSRTLFSAQNLTSSGPMTTARSSLSATARPSGAGLEKVFRSSILKRKQVKGRVLEMIK